MFVPGISEPERLEKRKGGGRGGKVGSGGSGGGSHSTASGGGTHSYGAAPVGFLGAGTHSTRSYSNGGGHTFPIPAGQAFSGRLVGGGTRGEIYGNKTYGSGYGEQYPMPIERGVAGRPFPFYFWPVVWENNNNRTVEAYLNATQEYGSVDNTTRPGGILLKVPFRSGGSSNTSLVLLADFGTIRFLITDIVYECHELLGVSEDDVRKFNATPVNFDLTPIPRPEEVIQYYRASSIALTLEGYKNSATRTNVSNGKEPQDTPIPDWVDINLVTCVNETIGTAALLVDGGPGMLMAIPSNSGLVFLVLVVSTILRVV